MLSLAPFALTRGTVLPQPGARASIVSAASTAQLSDELRQLQPAQPALTMDNAAVGFHTGLLKSGLLARNRDWARVHARTQAKAKRRRPPPLSDWHDDGGTPGAAAGPPPRRRERIGQCHGEQVGLRGPVTPYVVGSSSIA